MSENNENFEAEVVEEFTPSEAANEEFSATIGESITVESDEVEEAAPVAPIYELSLIHI